MSICNAEQTESKLCVFVKNFWGWLSSFFSNQHSRKPGLLKGKIEITDDFDEKSEELEKLFNEGGIVGSDL